MMGSLKIVLLLGVIYLCKAAEEDVLDLTDSDFSTVLSQHDTALVMFYAPWCGHCKRLKPEYAVAAGILKHDENPVALVKVDCTAEGKSTCEQHSVSGYPTLKIFRKGELSQEYNGPRESNGIVKYMRAQVGPSSKEIKSVADYEAVLTKDEVVVVGFFEKETDLKGEFLKAADKLREEVVFAHSSFDDVLKKAGYKNKSVPPIKQLLCALRFYATGCHLQTVSDMGGISVSTCSRIIKRVSEAIVTLYKEFIVFPDTEQEQVTVKSEFFKIAHFPNILGCIDCTHIKIQSPGGDDAELFRNRKGYMSINMQTISSPNLLITDVVARWPGSTHDSTIYQNSRRYERFERGDYRGSYLLGDSGYPLKSHLLTPFLNPATVGQQRYNTAHIKTRNVVERQYGVLKRRFPVLALGLRLKLQNAINVILACCILHNICILRQEPEPVNDGTIPNLENLIQVGQIALPPILNNDPVYGYQRSQITNYFENMN